MLTFCLILLSSSSGIIFGVLLFSGSSTLINEIKYFGNDMIILITSHFLIVILTSKNLKNRQRAAMLSLLFSVCFFVGSFIYTLLAISYSLAL